MKVDQVVKRSGSRQGRSKVRLGFFISYVYEKGNHLLLKEDSGT